MSESGSAEMATAGKDAHLQGAYFSIDLRGILVSNNEGDLNAHYLSLKARFSAM